MIEEMSAVREDAHAARVRELRDQVRHARAELDELAPGGDGYPDALQAVFTATSQLLDYEDKVPRLRAQEEEQARVDAAAEQERREAAQRNAAADRVWRASATTGAVLLAVGLIFTLVDGLVVDWIGGPRWVPLVLLWVLGLAALLPVGTNSIYERKAALVCVGVVATGLVLLIAGWLSLWLLILAVPAVFGAVIGLLTSVDSPASEEERTHER